MTITPLLIVFLTALHPNFAFTDYCKDHTFDRPTNTQVLRFSKENSDRDFGIYDKFKCLHCCCHGYRSIEWFKDGLPYPWPTNASTLIIRPESGNQTICSHRSTHVDSGRYWCLASNDTHSLKHEVTLQISGPSISMGWPKTTYKPRDQQADRGESVRFFCEAFVGTIDLPDFRSEITWERYDRNGSFIDGDRVLEEAIFREEKRVLGSYLYFREVNGEDYGEYTCKVRNLGDQVLRLNAWLKKRGEEEEVRSDGGEFWTFFFVVGALMVAGSAASSVCVFRLFRSRWWSSWRSVKDAKKDVLVIYHECNEREAMRAMSGLNLGLEEEVRAKAISYGAVMAVLSPSVVEWSCEGIQELIDGLLKVHSNVGCLFLEALPTPQAESGDWQTLKDSLRKIDHIVRTEESRKLWDLNTTRWFVRRKDSLLKGSSQALI